MSLRSVALSIVDENNDVILPSNGIKAKSMDHLAVDEQSLHSHCHTPIPEVTEHKNKKAEKVLWAVAVLSFLFICLELTGGIIAGSLAIMTDACHMISDLLSFFLSIVAIRIARRPASKKLSFGYERAEVLGALLSVIILWVLTTILVVLSIERINYGDLEVDANIMLITAGCGVGFNIIMGAVLHFGKAGHAHSHGAGGHGHGHGHSHDNGEGHGHAHGGEGHKEHDNMNVRAAFIHVIGDLIQSCGVLVAALIIKFTGWDLADPICTFLFSIIVLFTTVRVLWDIFYVLMEATPRHLDFNAIRDDLVAIDGVIAVHDLHLWSLNMDKTAMAVHLALENGNNALEIVNEAREIVRVKHNIEMATIQVESFGKSMEKCQRCMTVA